MYRVTGAGLEEPLVGSRARKVGFSGLRVGRYVLGLVTWAVVKAFALEWGKRQIVKGEG